VALVCVAFVAAELLLTVHGTALAWDETVYTSQVSGHVPAASFSAPRARGISLLAAPVAELTSSLLALRIYLALLSGVALFVSLQTWRTLIPARVLALAGGLFAGLWITLFYGPQVMPNLWSAFGALAAVGCFLRAAQDRTDRAALAGMAAGVAVVGLMRPPDAFWLVLSLAAAALAVRRWRRPAVFAVLVAGLLLGCGEWIVEAYVRFGGLSARLQQSSSIQGGLGRHFAVDDHIRALDGITLCRPCNVPWRHKIASAWWFALPLLAAGGAALVPRSRRAITWLALLAAVVLAAPYLFTIDYAAPRFLLPAYALVAIPVAECLRWLVTDRTGRMRPVTAVLVVLALCGHLAIQADVLSKVTGTSRRLLKGYDAAAARLHTLGVRPPCMLSGDNAIPIAFYTGCDSRMTLGADTDITSAGIVAAARSQPVAVLVSRGKTPPAYAATWRAEPLPGWPGYHAYLSPPPARSPR
jgi:hypothetical protein